MITASQNPLMSKTADTSYRKVVADRFRRWGWRGAAKAAGHGAAAAFGFFPTERHGPLKFMGGKKGMAGLGGLVGTAVWAATDNPLLGAAAGIGTSAAIQSRLTGSMKGSLGAFGRGLMPGFMAMSAIQGWKEGGLSGAAGHVASDVVTFAAFDVGIKAAGHLLRGTRLAAAGSSIGSAVGGAARFLGPVGLLAATAYTGYKALQGLARLGREGQRSEFTGDMSAFMTDAAVTMRSRAVQEIQRSHTNSRTVLGQEAQLLHL